MKFPEHVHYIEGTKNGPCVVIMGAVHGNERLGAEVVARLQHEIDPQQLHGDLFLIVANPAAYAANRRFIDTDLNRLFGPHMTETRIKNESGELNVEEKRALELAPFLDMADYLLDIHSTIKPSVPFVYGENKKQHLELAQLFETKFIVSPSRTFRPADLVSSADSYVDEGGGIGMTFEAGWHSDSSMNDGSRLAEVMAKTYLFLQDAGSLEEAAKKEAKSRIVPKTKPATHLEIYTSLIPLTPDFHFTKDFANFDEIEKGAIIALDQDAVFTANEKSFIVFPKVTIIPGAPAGYLARQLQPKK